MAIAAQPRLQPELSSSHDPGLQSMRGIAASAVMIHHALRTFADGGWAWTLSEDVFNAHAAVTLFFVLSGYVLTLSLLRRGLGVDGLTAYYVRRAFRIYPALWVAAAIGSAYLLLGPVDASARLSFFVRGHYLPTGLSAGAVAQTLLGAGAYLVPTAWTITVELCGSLLLPAFVLLLMKSPRIALLFLIVLAGMAGLVGSAAARAVPFYLFQFALGAMLAMSPFGWKLRPGTLGTLLAAIVLVFGQLLVPAGSHQAWLIALIEGLASFALVAGLVQQRFGWLRHTALVKIGDWSYSIYLLHVPIAFAIARAIIGAGIVSPGAEPIGASLVAVLTVVIVVPLSALVYRYVEVPGIDAGSLVLRRYRERNRLGATVPAARERR